MRFLILASLLGFAVAENFDVIVGQNTTITFTPHTVAAAVGDTVTFTWVAKTHSVTETSFDVPCPPALDGGFNSGLQTFTAGQPNPTFVLTVEDTDPHFAACAFNNGAHCRGGMLFILNPTDDTQFAQYQTNAANS